MAKKSRKLIANNKKARHDYFVEDSLEAGIVLTGTEIKSIRAGRCSIKESFGNESCFSTAGKSTKSRGKSRSPVSPSFR